MANEAVAEAASGQTRPSRRTYVASGADEAVAAYVADEAVAEAATVVTTAVAVKTTVITTF